jgi:hypothetical protein
MLLTGGALTNTRQTWDSTRHSTQRKLRNLEPYDGSYKTYYFPIIIVAYYTRQGRNPQICGDSKVELQGCQMCDVVQNGEYGKLHFLGDRDQ